jgi:DNA-binding transcriptional ArsR family regulator
MPKRAIEAWVHEPLTGILGSRAKVAALRVLVRAGTPISFREVVRRTGMAYRSVELALADLLAVGVVEQTEAGRERRVRFAASHRLAPAVGGLIRAEADFFPALRIELRAAAEQWRGDGLLALALVGSVARREERIGDRLELLAVTQDPAGAARVARRLEAMAEELWLRFGIRLLPITYDLARARSMWRHRTPAAERTVAEAELVFGEALTKVLDAKGES